jgi:hypothetical protein
MFKPHKNICSCCKKQSIVVVKKLLCAKCNYELKQANKKKPKSLNNKRNPTGEYNIFKTILDSFEDNPITCFVCGKRLSLVTHSNFAHILRKGRYERFRLNPDNIRIMCYNIQGTGCHSIFDNNPRSEIINKPEWQKVFQLEERLKQEYNSKLS